MNVVCYSLSSCRLVLLLSAVLALSPSLQAESPPRLIPQITVDQLRGDLPARHFDRFGEGGFRYLWEQGLVYTDAHHTAILSEILD